MSDIIKPMLCLSTAHLKPETFQLLANDEIDACIFFIRRSIAQPENAMEDGFLFQIVEALIALINMKI